MNVTPVTTAAAAPMIRRLRYALAAVVLVVALAGGVAAWPTLTGAEIVVNHAPMVFSRRAGNFTANITGLSRAHDLSYSVNGGPWRPLSRDGLRVHDAQFTIELADHELAGGDNLVTIRARGLLSSRTREVWFRYDNAPVSLPVRRSWDNASSLDVQDGSWETFDAGSLGWRIRPKPGAEDYDRIVVISGAFDGPRRITTDVMFHGAALPGKPYGFGVLPLWGGRPLPAGASLRSGWAFSLGWYYSHFGGVGMEFSTKEGGEDPDWVAAYRSLELRTDVRYRIVLETWPEADANGRHLRYRQRMQWHAEDDPAPDEWLELSDHSGAPLPAGEYAVALVAHRCRVDFGPVSVEAIPAPKKYSSALLVNMPK